MQQLPLDKSILAANYRVVKAFLNASEVAKLLKVDRATVTRWIKKGIIKGAIRPQGSQNWRIPLSVYEKITKNQ